MTAPVPPYNPFEPGPFTVGVHTIHSRDIARSTLFPCEVWHPAAAKPATYPLIVFSHHGGGNRRAASYLCNHLSSHGYIVAALDHFEVMVPELKGQPGETDGQRAARVEGWIANRVPDIRFLLDTVLDSKHWNATAMPDPEKIGIAGHSFGGWTALAATAVDNRIKAVVALAPAGSSQPKPGIIAVQLTFEWGRDVPTLYLVAEDDVSLPLAGMIELFERTQATKLMVILRRADHLHFLDNVEQQHEAVRNMPFTGKLAWIPNEMRPISELCSGEQAHVFARSLTLVHMDAALKQRQEAIQWLKNDIAGALAAQGVEAIVRRA